MLKPIKLAELLEQPDFGRNKLYATLERNINQAIFTDARIEIRDIPLRKAERLSKEARRIATEFIYVFYKSPIMNSTIPSPQSYKLEGTNTHYKTIAGKLKTGNYHIHGEFDSISFAADFIPAYLEEVKKGLKYNPDNVKLISRVPGNTGEATLKLQITENGYSKITTAKTKCELITDAIQGSVVIPRESYRSHSDFMDKLHKLFKVEDGFFTFRRDIMGETGDWIDVAVADNVINYHGYLRVLTSTSELNPVYHPSTGVVTGDGAGSIVQEGTVPPEGVTDNSITSGATLASVPTDEQPGNVATGESTTEPTTSTTTTTASEPEVRVPPEAPPAETENTLSPVASTVTESGELGTEDSVSDVESNVEAQPESTDGSETQPVEGRGDEATTSSGEEESVVQPSTGSTSLRRRR